LPAPADDSAAGPALPDPAPPAPFADPGGLEALDPPALGEPAPPALASPWAAVEAPPSLEPEPPGWPEPSPGLPAGPAVWPAPEEDEPCWLVESLKIADQTRCRRFWSEAAPGFEPEPPSLPLADWALLEDPPPEAPVPSDEAAALGSPGEPEAPELLLLALDAGEDAAASLDFVGADGELEDV
jgi:hypothetical protein